jgi:hypothetical protein
MSYYLHDGRRIPLEPSRHFMALRYRPGPGVSAAVAQLSKKSGFGEKRGAIELPADALLLLPIQPDASTKSLRASIKSSPLQAHLRRSTPVPLFESGDGSLLIPDGTVDADLSRLESDELDAFLLDTRSRLVRKPSSELPLHVLEPLDEGPIPFCLSLQEGPRRLPAQPRFRKFLPLSSSHSVRGPPPPPGEDPFLHEQWGLDAIRAHEAWNETRGDPTISVAVIDTGIDSTHEDLSPNLLKGYDFIEDDDDASPLPDEWNAHGTACAGIIAAAGNDKGISGVAPGCKLIPLRIAVCSQGHHETQNPDWENLSIIRAATTHRADVINISWAMKPRIATNLAVCRALKEGRNGKGCVIVAAAGNDDGDVNYPANVKGVIAVAATRRDGRRCTEFELNPGCGSCFGDEVSLAAPGHRIWTTDIMGPEGIWPLSAYKNPNYTHLFRGTSAACAFVSGVAALVLSMNKALDYKQVREILETSTNTLRMAEYGGGPRNIYLGHGLVDAYAAVLKAKPPPQT